MQFSCKRLRISAKSCITRKKRLCIMSYGHGHLRKFYVSSEGPPGQPNLIKGISVTPHWGVLNITVASLLARRACPKLAGGVSPRWSAKIGHAPGGAAENGFSYSYVALISAGFLLLGRRGIGKEHQVNLEGRDGAAEKDWRGRARNRSTA